MTVKNTNSHTTKGGLLSNNNYKYLWTGRVVSNLGDSAQHIGVYFYLAHTTNSAPFVGIAAFLSGFASLLSYPLSGIFADRYSRKNIMIICDTLSGFVVLILVLSFFFMQNKFFHLIPYIIVICSILLSIISTFLWPAFGAIIPDIVERKDLSSANSLYKSAIRIGNIIGETTSGFIYNAFGASKLFAFNSLTFFLSALLISRLSNINIIPQKTTISGNRFSLPKLINEFRDGLHAITNINGATEFFIMALVVNFLATPIFVLMPFQVARIFGSGAATYGLLMASFSVGIVVGYILSGRHLIKFKNPYIIIYAIVIMCAFFILFALSENIYLSYLSLFFAGVSNGFWSIIFETSVQLIMPKESLGRIYSLFGLMSGGLTPIASLFSGFTLAMLDNNTRILFSVCALLMTAFPVIMLMNKNFVSFFDVLRNNYSE
ncbi:hypothetical protein B1757_10410 [Acidithiobacillus marinus]|uniref:Major facilitator superfamily (MFS) profile domain-containing protein n=1 Tax=Acidithiobacillus marinus TaxID=187490 RepID=A0A2I1DKA0_9PROT|nr:MFS transporter [Acidithiobacillus marinus]PKY10276.1 hypothetical protein B1757_10410 [Acidithiobacillus marinus]